MENTMSFWQTNLGNQVIIDFTRQYLGELPKTIEGILSSVESVSDGKFLLSVKIQEIKGMVIYTLIHEGANPSLVSSKALK